MDFFASRTFARVRDRTGSPCLMRTLCREFGQRIKEKLPQLSSALTAKYVSRVALFLSEYILTWKLGVTLFTYIYSIEDLTAELNVLGYTRSSEDMDAQKLLVLLTTNFSRSLVTMMYGMDEHVSSAEKEVGAILNQQLKAGMEKVFNGGVHILLQFV